MEDESICRFDRAGDPNARLNALTARGSVALDTVQSFRPENISEAALDTSDVIAEIHFPRAFDLKDVLNICRAIHEGDKTRNYTLASFNCFFFALAIQCCLTRFVARWEEMMLGSTLVEELYTAIDAFPALFHDSQHSPPAFLRAYSILNPKNNWTTRNFLDEVRYKLSSSIDKDIFVELNNALWYQSLSSVPVLALERSVKKAVTKIIRRRLAPCRTNKGSNCNCQSPLEQGAHQCILMMRRLLILTNKSRGGGTPPDSIPKKRLWEMYRSRVAAKYLIKRQSTSPSGPTANRWTRMNYQGSETGIGPEEVTQIMSFAQCLLILHCYIKDLLPWIFGLALSLCGVTLFTTLDSRPCVVIDDELEYAVSKLESIHSPSNLESFYARLHTLCIDKNATWNRSPWWDILQTITDSIPSDLPTIETHGTVLKVAFNGEPYPEATTVRHFQDHILSRIRSQARLVNNVSLADAETTRIELEKRLMQIWALIRDDKSLEVLRTRLSDDQVSQEIKPPQADQRSNVKEPEVATMALYNYPSSLVHTYAAAIRSGHQCKSPASRESAELPIVAPATTTSAETKEVSWSIVTIKKREKQPLPSGTLEVGDSGLLSQTILPRYRQNDPRSNAASYGSASTNGSLKYKKKRQSFTKATQQNRPIIEDQFEQDFFNKGPHRKKDHASSLSNTHLSGPDKPTATTDESEVDTSFLEVLLGAGSDNLETWWQILGFAKVQQGPIKVSDCIEALEAVGFSLGRRNKSQITFCAPSELKETQWRSKLPCLTLHIPRGANVEDNGIRDIANAIRKKYPNMVNVMHKVWTETGM
ncbi:phosphatidylinositol 4-kinase [Rhizoctonia solani]|uniref:Phosphatidylinositol 4-kinase n=1 Tax=Rhizoctonia solani TaxID=456999 RepID=A0A0K6GCW8_9AGAM|nr:phosphatidylinositol 4-kinase [Rhizoctonia solani]